MQVLILGYVWPEPASSAAGSRMLQLIEFFLARDDSVTFASAAASSSHMADIGALGVQVCSIELNSSRFDAFLLELQPEIVLFDRFMIEEQFGWRVAQHCPDALRVLDTEDLHCLRDASQRACKAGREVSKQDLNSKLAMREVAAILRSDLTLMISPYEMELLSNHYRVDPALLLHLPFMLPPVDPEAFVPYRKREGYISIGNFRHAPNWDAVRYLKSTLWPLIRARQPGAQLRVYGAYPPPAARQLHNPKEGFLVEGWAEDAGRVMRAAKVCLAPLRFGAGLKGKLIDAMCNGTPNVSTSIAAEGMHGELPWSGGIEDDPQDFADAAVSLYASEPDWLQAQSAGVDIINTLYPRTRLGQQLQARLVELGDTLASHRLKNFTGAMLRHHNLQSTRYMAQWIEAKNKLRERESDGT